MWTELRARVVDAVRGVDPFVLFGAGLLAVVVLFGALTLVIVGGTDGLDDLGLGLPGSRGSGPSAEGDPADGGVTGGQGDGLTDGLAARETERRSTTTSAAPTGASGDESSAAASPTEQPAGGASSGPAPHGSGDGSTTTDTIPPGTAPPTTSTTTGPTTSTTVSPDDGLLGGLLDVLGLGG